MFCFFFTEFCNKTNSMGLISNMAIAFSNFSLKICRSGIFGFKIKDFFFEPNFAIKEIQER